MTPGHAVHTTPSTQRVRVVVSGRTVAESDRAVELHETGLPVRHYVPADDVRMDLLTPTTTTTYCPFKGDAVYWSLDVDGRRIDDVAWSYPEPIPGRADITGLVCFFAERVDEVRVGGDV